VIFNYTEDNGDLPFEGLSEACISSFQDSILNKQDPKRIHILRKLMLQIFFDRFFEITSKYAVLILDFLKEVSQNNSI
jgi:hypothetical protein